MLDEVTIVDNQPTNPPVTEEQNNDGGENGTPKQPQASKNFEKLLKQRNEARKAEDNAKSDAEKLAEENALLKKQIEEKKTAELPDIDSLIEKKLSERLSKVDNEARQKENLFTQYPEARTLASEIEQVAKAHPTLSYEHCYQLVNPTAFISEPSNNNLDGGKAPETKKKAFKDLSFEEQLHYNG